MMMFHGPGLILTLVAALIAMAAQGRVKSTFARYSSVGTRRGVTAEQVARMLLDRFGLTSVEIKRVRGHLTDHYDPRDKSLGLSESVYGYASIAAIGVAAHEVGHAIQHSAGYAPLAFRNSIVPVMSFGSTMAIPVIMIGFLFRGPLLIDIGILLFIGVVIFHLVTLPVEFNASSRAVAILGQTGALNEQELDGAGRMLKAAAWTYIATTVVAFMHLVYFLFLRGSSD